MFQARFIQEGDAIDYTPAADVAAGDVVIAGEVYGVAKLDVKAGERGVLAMSGVFESPKATGVLEFGAKAYWDSTAKNITATAASNKQVGYVVAAAASDDAVVRWRLGY